MNQRLQQFLSAENISQSQFADSIGVARANVSHIISGRNKPGFDFIEKLSSHYPSLSLEWLISGKGKMYKNGESCAPAVTLQSPSAPDELFDTESYTITAEEQAQIPSTATANSVSGASNTQPRVQSKTVEASESNNANKIKQSIKNQRNITKIIVFYDDNSFQELK